MKRAGRAFLVVLAVLGCFAFGFSWRDLQQFRLPSAQAVNTLLGVKTTKVAAPEQVFSQNYKRILADYVKPVKPDQLKYAGMEGLMASLGDPHTLFMPPRAAEAFADETRANFFGVGARLMPDPLGAKVSSVFEDGPAYAAGLRGGNLITGVDGKSVSGKDIDSIVDKIKGKEGTVVHLQVIQKNSEKPVTLAVTRRRIVIPTVESKYLSDSQIGYMSIASFSEPTALQFDRELAKLEANPMKGLVIDLRDNPGGLLETAVDMLSRFVDGKVAVRMKFRGGKEEVANTYSGETHKFGYPVVLLVNEDSASAAEIFSGVLKDYGKATLVGTHTYGKASVQNVFPLVDRSSAKITIARYYLPFTPFFGRKVDEDGAFISGGLEPDVKVEQDFSTDVTPGDPKTDAQLRKAIEVALSKAH